MMGCYETGSLAGREEANEVGKDRQCRGEGVMVVGQRRRKERYCSRLQW